MDDLAGMTTGQRLRFYRRRAGMSRPILGGLIGRSAEWVKSVETGKMLTPRLPMLIRLAEVLDVDDLAKLTGDQRLSTATFTRGTHEALPAVARSLASYPIVEPGEPISAVDLSDRVMQTWGLWHGTKRQRTAIAGLLPTLLGDAQVATRRLDGSDRRSALRSLAQAYHLTQLFLSFQPAPELVTMTGDRGFIAAQDADDPHAVAAAAWYLNHVFRDAGQQHEARVQLATDAAALLRPEAGTEDRALWGLLHLAIALSHAKRGYEGEAWAAWDQADRAVRALPPGYMHPWLMFGRATVDAYAITMHADLAHGAEAVHAADRVDPAALPSATRRSFHLIETARGYSQRSEPVATVHLLRRAWDESPDTLRFNLFARSAVIQLREQNRPTMRAEVNDLARKLDVAV